MDAVDRRKEGGREDRVPGMCQSHSRCRDRSPEGACMPPPSNWRLAA